MSVRIEEQKNVDDVSFNVNLSRYFMVRVLPYLKSPVLDLGCGVGVVSQMLVERGFEIVGIDGNSAKIELAKFKMPNTMFVCTDFFDFRSEREYNTIIVKNVLEHLIELDSLRLLKKIHDWLRPHGHCVAYVPNLNALHKRIGAKMGFKPTTAMDITVGHAQTYTADKLQRQFDDAGFCTVKRGGLILKPFPNDFMVLLNERYLDALFAVSAAPSLEEYCSGIYIIGKVSY